MSRKAIFDLGLDIGSETAVITGAFLKRNVLVLSGLALALLFAFAR